MIQTRCKVAMVFLLLPLYAQGGQDLQEYPWLDDFHRSVAESVEDTAQWFDDFFHNENIDQETPKARGEAKIRLSWEPRTRDLSEFKPRVRVRVKLPKLKDRVDLIFADYDDDVPDDKVRAGRVSDFNRQDRFTLALQFKPKRDSGFAHRIGTGRRAQIYVKSRYRTQINFDPTNDIRWEASVYYYNRDRFGADTAVTFDHKTSSDNLLRFDNRFYFRDKTDDWLWQHSAQYFHQVDDRTAIISGAYIEGLSRPTYRLEEYLVSIRWRQNTLREWLFYEIEPFILWRRDEQFSASYGVALRLEGYFGKD